MVSKRYHLAGVIIICAMMGIFGCVDQDAPYVSSGNPVKVHTRTLIATGKFLYAIWGSLFCFDWEGNVIWESQDLESVSMILCGDAFFVDAYDVSKDTGTVALLDQEGHILWQRETGLVSDAAIGASGELLAAGSRRGILYAFSKAGDVLWTYSDTYAVIDQVAVAPDSSCVAFTDYDEFVKCVRDGELVWQSSVGKLPYTGNSRTLVFAPDSSYLVYGSAKDEPHIVVSTLDGEELWLYPLEDNLQSVAITYDSHYIIAATSRCIYKFTSDGTVVWKTTVGKDNRYIAITPEADFIAFGSIESFFSYLIVLNGDGEVLWEKRKVDNIFAVVISPDGKYVAFSSRNGRMYIYLYCDTQ